MQLPAAGFCALIILPTPQKPVSGLSARTSGYRRLQKTSRLAPTERRGTPPGVMVFALLDDFVNLKNLHIQNEGKNPCHPQTAATCTYRRTL